MVINKHLSHHGSLQQDTRCPDNDSPEHCYTGPRIDSPETNNTPSTSKLGDRSSRPDPAIQKTPGGREYGRQRTHEPRGEQSIYLESRWRRGFRQTRKSDHRRSQTYYLPCQPHSPSTAMCHDHRPLHEPTYTLVHKHADSTPQTLHPREPLLQNHRPPNSHATGTNMHGSYPTYTTDSRVPAKNNSQGERGNPGIHA